MTILIFLIISYILLSISLYLLFPKAEVSAIKGLIPGVNFVEWCKLIGRKPVYALWLIFPVVNLFIFCGMAVDIQGLPVRHSRLVKIGNKTIGGTSPIALQSMCATKTTDIPATISQIHLLEKAGADLIRIAVDSKKDVEALREIRKETTANLVIDLQENYRLASAVAPYVQKFRYNPGHLHHHQREVSVRDKVKFLVEVAGTHNCAMRIGVNFGSLDPALKKVKENPRAVALKSAYEHCDLVESLGFKYFVVSLKS